MASAAPRAVTTADLFRVRWLDDPQISADGARIAFTVSALDQERDALMTSVYVCDAEPPAGEGFYAFRTAAREPGGMPPAGAGWRVGPAGLNCRSPRWSPDGERLCVPAGAAGAEQLWVMAADGGGAQQLTHAAGGVTQACWSPDGQRVAYAAGDDHQRQLWTIDADGTDAACISDGRWDDDSPAWSPDGRSIAFLSRRDSPFADLWITTSVGRRTSPSAAANAAPRETRAEGITFGTAMPAPSAPASSDVITRGDHVRAGSLLAAGVTPAAQSAEQAAKTAGQVVRAGEPPRRLTQGAGPIRAPAWSPDSRWIAYIGHTQGHAQGVNFGLYVIGSDGMRARDLCTGLDRSIGQVVRADDLRGMETPAPAWSHDGKRIYFTFADGGVSHIGWATLDGQTGVAVGGERACLAFSMASRADRIAFVASDSLNPGEIHTAMGDGQCEGRVTGFNEDWLREVSLSKPERMRFACDDGQEIEGWLMRPPAWSGERRYPLILQIHGGPHYPLGERFYFDFQRLAAQGSIVLYCNPRGSQGYGEQFATCIRGAWGARDSLDLMQVLDIAADFVEVDASRLAVTGVSYGGFMTNWLIGHTERFRAAICENGISNLTSNFRTSVHSAEFWTWEIGGTPESEPERYRALSPISYADQMHTPLVLIHAEQDENCAIAQSEELYDALEALGRPVSLVRIPDEGHLMDLVGKPSARLLRMAVIDEWLERWM